MPDPLEWCVKLGVKTAHSDPLTLDDLSSAKQTRMAAHRELIKRRPGTYPRRFLAGRLGVSVGSIDTYNDEIPIFYHEQFIETRLCWSNLHIIPDDLTVAGTFLEDESGKRYPALRPLAAKLLRQGKFLTYKRQDANYYWFGEGEREVLSTEYRVQSERQNTVLSSEFRVPRGKQNTVASYQLPVAGEGRRLQEMIGQVERQIQVPSSEFRVPREAQRLEVRGQGEGQEHAASVGTRTISSLPNASANVERNLAKDSGVPDRGVQSVILTKQPIKREDAKKAKPKREPSGRRRLKDDALEKLAGWVYERVNARSTDAALHISMVVARKLVSRYNRAGIEKAMRLMEARHNITKPAGFFITVLRADAKRASRDKT
jgi:hypothetical protein